MLDVVIAVSVVIKKLLKQVGKEQQIETVKVELQVVCRIFRLVLQLLCGEGEFHCRRDGEIKLKRT